MAQQHLDRLTAVDASFLAQEGPASHMHIGGIVVCEGPAPGYEEMLDHIRGRLHLVPRYRQKLAQPPLETGRPLWVDDPNFNLEYHVRQTALPAPGDEGQLMQLVARIMSQQLDRSKPLWEMWIIEGLDDGGFALISKTHHALIDGISGVDLATVMFDLSPVPADVPHPDEPWQPHDVPSGTELVAGGALGAARAAAAGLAGAVSLVRNPGATLRALSEASQGLGEVAWAGLNPAPETPLNVEIGPHRRYRVVRNQLTDFKEVKNALGGTVNDVVLTVVTGALRDWLHSRGVRTEGLELRALVPVSTRGSDERGALGNRITVMRGPLPVYIADPIARLRAVRAAMDGLKESKQAVGAEVLTGVQSFAPPTILAQASRLNFSTRLFNLIVTNVPGPQLPLYVRGREMHDVFPVAFLPRGHSLAIAIMSYNGQMNFGLLGDYDALPDLDRIADGIEASLAELLSLARHRGPRIASPNGNGAAAESTSEPAPTT
ncbi:WS/DGAT/MGAT family O-acyltransferase [Conexibacter woesei]|uniref:WS/DGAT/MGAT family O-acyltransferase n=1 Tax=Conexibacter woesei TaxID=191495 RepID=UPI00041D2C25|nr:wax ester/triacylglycerol synthase family O-acyltransferase [Conexibacter woesei]